VTSRSAIWTLAFFGALLALAICYWNGLLWFFYPILYPVFVFIISYTIYRAVGRGFVGWAVAALMVIFPVFEISVGSFVMRSICAKEHPGVHIYQKQAGVKGFYSGAGYGCDGLCEDALLNHGFDFVEAQLSSAALSDARNDVLARALSPGTKPLLYLATEPGFYRFSKEREGHPDCTIFEKWLDSLSAGSRPKRFKGICISSVQISSPTAVYEFSEMHSSRATFMGSIKKTVKQVLRRDSGEVLGEAFRYAWQGEPVFQIHAQISGNYACPDVISFSPWDVLMADNK